MHSGEFFYEKVDLEIPGRGMNWRHVRRYRSQINHDGQQGLNWTFNYDRRVIVACSGTSVSCRISRPFATERSISW